MIHVPIERSKTTRRQVFRLRNLKGSLFIRRQKAQKIKLIAAGHYRPYDPNDPYKWV